MNNTQSKYHAKRLAGQGYTAIADAVSGARIHGMRDALDRVEREHRFSYAASRVESDLTVRIYKLLAYGEAFWRVLPRMPRPITALAS